MNSFEKLGSRARKLLALLLAVSPGVIIPAAALAAPPEEPVTFYETATVEARPVTSATAPVTVLDRKDLERLGAVTAADALRYVPGVTIDQAGGRGGLSVARIRGGDPNFTLVLVDGVPVNDDTYQVGGVFDLEGLPASAIERIEVVRGPFSSFYGSTGLGGVVHIVTRRGGEAGAARAGEAGLTAGDAGLFGGQALLSGPGYAVGASWEEESGRVAEESFEQLHLHGHRSWAWGEPAAGTKLQLSGRATGWNADDYPDASGGPVYGDGALRSSEHKELGLSLLLETGGGAGAGRHAFSAGFYRHGLDRDSPAIVPLVPASTEETTFTRLQAGWTWSRGLDLGKFGQGARLSLGAEVEREEGSNDSVLLLPPFLGGAVAGDYSLSRTTPGLSGELLASRGRLDVELGARLDVPDSNLQNGRSHDPGPQLSPRLGLAWQLGEPGGAWRLRASAGRAFKLPSFFALASPPALGGNPDLEPETMTGGDLGLEWRSPQGSDEAGLGVFVHHYKNLVDFDFDLFTHLNRSQVDAEGIEAWFAWRPAVAWNVAGDLTYQDVEDRATGEPLRQRPRWSGGLRLDWSPRETLSFHLDGRHVSERRDEQIPVPQLTEVPGATVAGLGGDWRLPISTHVMESLRLHVRIDNLFDRDYETHLGFPAPGRSLRAGLRAGF
jgi:vitamin B12 transporter